MTTIYTPTEGSFIANVCDFFSANQDELLTNHDIGIKFGVAHAGVHTRLSKAVDAGLLSRAINLDGDMVYSAGLAVRLKQGTKPPEPTETPAKPIKATERMARAARTQGEEKLKYGQRLPQLNVDELDYRDDVPRPQKPMPKNESKYEIIFARLNKVGMSVGIPDVYEKTMRSAAVRIKKKTGHVHSIVRDDAGQMRIWRTQ